MDIGEVIKPKEKLFENRYAEWEKLIPLSEFNRVKDISY